MSRIEEALAKAAALRKPQTEPAAVEAPRPAPRPLRAVPVVEETPIEIANPLLVTVKDPYSPAAEEYRKLKSSLVALLNGEESLRNTIMITSAVSSEGKTLTSVNLALALAQEFDYTVLLVDADLRRPSVCQTLGIEGTSGLSDCLTGGVDVGDVLIRTGVGRLSVLPAGPVPPNPAELFSSSMMSDLIVEIRSRYSDRFIIFDAPPVLPFAETRSLGRLVDATLLVVKEGVPDRRQVEEALQALKETNLAGVVYNGATSRNDDHHYYRAYGYAAQAEPAPAAPAKGSAIGNFFRKFRA